MNKPEKQYVNAEGKYLAKVKTPGNGWLGETSSGTRFVRVPVVVTDEGPQQGREVVWYGYLSEAAEDRTVKTLNEIFGLGWTFDALFAGRVSWAGALVSVTVVAEQKDGKTYYNAKWLNPPIKKAEIEEEEVQRWDKKLAAIRGTAPAPAAMKTKTEDGDDIPF